MASPILKSLFINSDSNFNTQSKLFKLNSELFKDLTANNNFNALSSTKFFF